MNIRCAFCQTPYTLSRVEMLDALQEMDSKKLTHYDAHCPRCRRATQIPRQRLEMAMPKWQEELKEFEAEMKKNPQLEVSPPASEAAPVKQAESAPEPSPVKAKTKADTRAKPITKNETGRKPAARSELGNKAPANNTPAASSSRSPQRSRGKKKSK